jgi:hypothetical protein
LNDDDFLPASAAGGNSANTTDPLICERARPADQINDLKLEYLDRTNGYNTDIVEAKDDASIQVYGLNPASVTQAHFFCDVNAALISAYLQLGRQAIRNTWKFTLGWKYCVLDPMDIVSVTDSAMGVYQQWVRILEIEEDAGGNLSITAEEYLTGTGNAALYNAQQNSGYQPNYNAAPPRSTAPLFFEPTFELTGGALQIALAVAGNEAQGWGGCYVYVSLDNLTYELLATQFGPARYGVTTSTLPAVASDGLDLVSTVGVDISGSFGTLASGSLLASQSNSSLCHLGGEFLSYGVATLTGTGLYTLSQLNRGQYDTVPNSVAAGAAFARYDSQIQLITISQDYIGKAIYVKIVDFNSVQGGAASIADVEPYIYVFQGTAYTEPLPPIENLTTIFQANIETLTWDAVTDSRNPIYEVRQGATWGSAQVVTQTASNSTEIINNGTYWVAAYFLAPTGFEVYGAPSEVTVQGQTIVRNALISFEESTAWSGAKSGVVAVGGALQLDAAGNILTDANILAEPSILNLGGWLASGTYTVPSAHAVNAGRVLDMQLRMTYAVHAVSIYDNILTVANFLGISDLLEVANGPVISVTPQVQVAQANGIYGPWVNFNAGQYVGQYFNFRLVLATDDPTINCIVSNWSIMTDVPDRDDVGTAVSVPSGGLTVTYAAPFNNLPNTQITIVNAQANDVAVLSGQSLTGFAVQITNGGTGVARIINWASQGY